MEGENVQGLAFCQRSRSALTLLFNQGNLAKYDIGLNDGKILIFSGFVDNGSETDRAEKFWEA